MPNVASTESGGSVMFTLHHNISSLLRAVTILPEATRSSMRLAITCRLNGSILDSRLFIYVPSQAHCLDNTDLDNSPGQYCIYGTDLLSCWYFFRYCKDYLGQCVGWIYFGTYTILRSCWKTRIRCLLDQHRLSHAATSFQPQ